LALVFVLYVGAIVWAAECLLPSGGAARALVQVVRLVETQELAATGRVGDIDARLRSEKHHVIGLDHYRVLTRGTGVGYDVVIKPTGWCFCRATYILRAGGKELVVVKPLLGSGR
jgi:hypothetical protein